MFCEFNQLCESLILGKTIFFALLKYSSDNALFHELVPYLGFFETWIASWKLPEDEEDPLKEMFYLVSKELPGLTVEQKNNLQISENIESLAFVWLKKYLALETVVDQRSIHLLQSCRFMLCRFL